jgi:hypothetical protein
MSGKRRELNDTVISQSSAPKYVQGTIVIRRGQLALETNEPRLLKTIQILLRRMGFRIETEGISPCG